MVGGDEYGFVCGLVVEDSGVIFFLRGYLFGEYDGVIDLVGGISLFGDEFVFKYFFGVFFGLSGIVK